MRIPLGVSIESRDGTTDQDAKVVNGVVENRGKDIPPLLRKRPGISDLGAVASAGAAQLLFVWNGIKAIIADVLSSGTIGTITSTPATDALTPTNASLRFDAQDTSSDAATPRLFFKNRTQAWVIDRAGTVTAVTYGGDMGSSTYTLISLTRSVGTATATLAEDVFNVGDTVTIAGAVQVAYNGAQTVTAVTVGVNTPLREIPITVTRSGTTATATTVSGDPHALTNGVAYTIAGANQSAYNGSKTITTSGGDSFTYTVTVIAGSAVTWNPADKGAGITLSGGNLTAAGSGAFEIVRANTGKSSGKWYWEITVVSGGDASGNYNSAIGICDGSTTVSHRLGDGGANSWGYYGLAQIDHLGAHVGFGAVFRTGDIIGVALDMDSKTLQFYKNGVGSGATQTGLSAVAMFPALMPKGDTFTANFGATAFTYPAPSGFSATYQTDDPVTPASGTIIVTDPASFANPTFSFTVAGSPATPATGTITAQGDGGTVPGCPYINGYIFVMDVNGVMWHCDSDDPTTWDVLSRLPAQNENGKGRAISKSQSYLVGFKEWSSEFFYDAQNAAQFAFSPMENGFTRIGCASGESVAEVGGALLWIAQSKEEQSRSVYMQRGLEQQKVSTPDVDRILSLDSLGTVYAYGASFEGHTVYIVTLKDSDITLVYDLSSQAWTQWSSLTQGGSVSVYQVHRLSDQSGLLLEGLVESTGNTQHVQIIAEPSYTIVSGDTLQYDVYIDPRSPYPTEYASGAVQINFSDASGLDITNDADGYSMSLPAVGFDALARGVWKTRSASLVGKIGLTATSVRVRDESNGVGYHRALYRNIKIVNGSTTKLNVYGTSGAPQVNRVHLLQLYETNSCGFGFLPGDPNVAIFSTTSAHGIEDGEPTLTSGATQTEYNGTFLARVHNPTVFEIDVDGLPTTPATGTILCYPFTESYFKFSKAASYQGQALFLHESDGHLYRLQSDLYQDDGAPINLLARTTRMDGGSTEKKRLPHVRVICNRVDDVAAIRWSNNDCQTFGPYRRVYLNKERPQLRRQRAFRRRTYELRHVGNTPLQIEGLEIE